ncbi:MAG: hypothetical protein ACOCPM_07215 [Bacteroidales bacterium]
MIKDLKKELEELKKDLPPRWTSLVANKCNCSEALVSAVWSGDKRDRRNIIVTTYDVAIENLKGQQEERSKKKKEYNQLKQKAS